MKYYLLAAATLVGVMATPAAAQELIVNGGFEASSSQTITPTGWTNVGHSDGVIAYSVFGTPAYQGSNFYDLGGYGNASGPVGDGIQQTVATIINSVYTLNFGLSSENRLGSTTLQVFFNSLLAGTYVLGVDGTGDFKKPFTTQTLSYTATSNSTTIKFIESANTSGGGNDPLIDGVSFQSARSTGAVPEPATWAMMLIGFGVIGAGMRRRRTAVRVRFAV